jgi:hypothetical protein
MVASCSSDAAQLKVESGELKVKGSDATAAGGGKRELSEWQRSARDEGTCAEDMRRAPQQDAAPYELCLL